MSEAFVVGKFKEYVDNSVARGEGKNWPDWVVLLVGAEDKRVSVWSEKFGQPLKRPKFFTHLDVGREVELPVNVEEKGDKIYTNFNWSRQPKLIGGVQTSIALGGPGTQAVHAVNAVLNQADKLNHTTLPEPARIDLDSRKDHLIVRQACVKAASLLFSGLWLDNGKTSKDLSVFVLAAASEFEDWVLRG